MALAAACVPERGWEPASLSEGKLVIVLGGGAIQSGSALLHQCASAAASASHHGAPLPCAPSAQQQLPLPRHPPPIPPQRLPCSSCRRGLWKRRPCSACHSRQQQQQQRSPRLSSSSCLGAACSSAACSSAVCSSAAAAAVPSSALWLLLLRLWLLLLRPWLLLWLLCLCPSLLSLCRRAAHAPAEAPALCAPLLPAQPSLSELQQQQQQQQQHHWRHSCSSH